MFEFVVVEFFDEGGVVVEFSDGDCNVCWSVVGGFEEVWSFGEGDVGDGGNEVY